MPHPRRRLVAAVLLALAAATLGGGVALAAWASSGAGGVSQLGGSLSAPTDLAVGAGTCNASTGQSLATWTASTSATGYLVEAARDTAFSDLVASQTTSETAATVTYPVTSSSYPIYVRVRATDASWTSATAATATSATCTAGAPDTPTGFSAADNTCSGSTGSYTATQPVTWTAVPGATSYVVDAAQDSAFNQVLQSQTVSATAASFSSPVPNGSFVVYLRVKAVTGDLSSAYATTSATLMCPRTVSTTTSTAPATNATPTTSSAPATTTASAPTAPTGLAVGSARCSSGTGPGGGPQTATQSVSWNPVSGATSYTLEAASGSGFSPVLDSSTTSTTSTSLSFQVPNGRATVYYRVSAQAGTTQGAYATTSALVTCH